ncbi:hypothetical protein Pmani_029532 [Petrolisthes manimaculis]|uniref:Yippee domain-containing protein n=1 Tax=Petrolisthes manimaculis TaxID=1843537 RepID=A0AAE1NZC8_9EUCA|nr:hypothetical protein Pmani_029532 [Petrolisthes manimaculis]
MGRLNLQPLHGPEVFQCSVCNTALTTTRHLLSMRFLGNTGRAYLFASATNYTVSEVEDRDMLTGRHFIRNVFCKKCKTKLGWVYEFAYEDGQRMAGRISSVLWLLAVVAAVVVNGDGGYDGYEQQPCTYIQDRVQTAVRTHNPLQHRLQHPLRDRVQNPVRSGVRDHNPVQHQATTPHPVHTKVQHRLQHRLRNQDGTRTGLRHRHAVQNRVQNQEGVRDRVQDAVRAEVRHRHTRTVRDGLQDAVRTGISHRN